MIYLTISPGIFSKSPHAFIPNFFPHPAVYILEKLQGNKIVEEGFKEMTQSVKCWLGKSED